MRALATAFLSLFLMIAFSQNHFPDLSPNGKLKQKVGFTTFEINYERPAARGRKVMGDLVPYDELWRTGAGNCTKIKFSNTVTIDGRRIAAGTYSLFTIPNPTQWTIILNNDTTLYGTGRYNQMKEVLRFKATTKKAGRHFESLTIDIDVVPNNAIVYISWEDTQVSFVVETETDKRTESYIEQNLLNNKSQDPDEYATAAEYYFYLNRELDEALTLIGDAIERKNELWYSRLRVDILEKQKKYPEAIDAAYQAIKLIEQRTDLDGATRLQSIEEYKKSINRMETIKSKSRH